MTTERIGWVIETYEDGSVSWWHNEDGWVPWLNDGAQVFTESEHTNANLPLDGTWVEVFAHGDGGDLLTTEPCDPETCEDCAEAIELATR